MEEQRGSVNVQASGARWSRRRSARTSPCQVSVTAHTSIDNTLELRRNVASASRRVAAEHSSAYCYLAWKSWRAVPEVSMSRNLLDLTQQRKIVALLFPPITTTANDNFPRYFVSPSSQCGENLGKTSKETRTSLVCTTRDQSVAYPAAHRILGTLSHSRNHETRLQSIDRGER